MHVDVEGAGCPNSALVEQALVPLIGGDAEAPADSAGSARASVHDLGERYRVEIGAVAREFDDSARDCRERARVAAVFIALNRKEAQAAPKPPAPAPQPPKPQPQPDAKPDDDDGEPELEPPAPTAFEDRADVAHYGIQLFGTAAFAPDPSKLAPGGGGGSWLTTGAFRFELSAGVLAPTDIDLRAQGSVNGSVSLLRVPASVSASYLLRAGAFRFGPMLGFALDVLQLSGKNLPDPQRALRVNPGGLAALDAHARLGREWLGLLRLSLSAFPRAYDLAVDRAGKLGSIPRLWLAATLGFEYQIR